MCSRAERATIYLGKAEECIVGSDDDVGISDETNAATDTESGHRSNHRDFTLVHRSEGVIAALIGANEGIESLGVLHFLDVDPGVESSTLRPENDGSNGAIGPESAYLIAKLEPFRHSEGVDWRTVLHNLGNAVCSDAHFDTHRASTLAGDLTISQMGDAIGEALRARL